MAINLFQPQQGNIFKPNNPMQQSTTVNTWTPQPMTTSVQPINQNPMNQSAPLQNGQQRIEGSYRALFKSIKLDHVPQDNLGGPAYSTHIIQQPEYKGLSQMMLRLEDYYLIRTQNIDQHHKSQIQRACQMSKFDSNIITRKPAQQIQPPQFPVNQQNRWSDTRYSPYNRQQTTTSTLFQPQPYTQQTTQMQSSYAQNIFQPNQTANIFQPQQQQQQQQQQQYQYNAPWNNTQQQQNQNVFQNPQNNQQQMNPFQPQQNIFQPQQQFPNNQSQNIFQQPMGQSYNIFQQQPQQSNIFSNNQSNIFQQQQSMQNPFYNNNNIFQQPLQNNMFANNNNNMLISQQRYLNPYPLYTNMQFPQYYSQQTPRSDEQIISLFEFANTLTQECSKYMQLKEAEQAKYQQQENMIKENERIYQQERLERERKYAQRLAKKQQQHSSSYVASRSPSPYSAIGNTNVSRISQVSKNSVSPLRKSIILTTKQTGKKSFRVRIYFAESDKYYPQEFISEGNMLVDLKSTILKQLCAENVLINTQRYKQYSQFYNADKSAIIDDSKLSNQELNQLVFQVAQTDKPILSKPNYNIKPSLNELQCLDLGSLQRIPKIEIWNEYGMAKWTNVDVTYLNLDILIDILDCEINVYDETIIHPYLKPEQGKKLNKQCQITFKLDRFLPRNALPNYQEIEQKLQKVVSEQEDTRLIGINQSDKSFMIQVEHFTRYTFSSDFVENDDSSAQYEQQPQNQPELIERNFEEENQLETQIQQGVEEEQQPMQRYQFEDSLQELQWELNKLQSESINQYPLEKNDPKLVEQMIERIQKVNQRTYHEKYPCRQILGKQFDLNPFINLKLMKQSDILDRFFEDIEGINLINNEICARLCRAQMGLHDNEIHNTLHLINILFGNVAVNISYFMSILRMDKSLNFQDLNQFEYIPKQLIGPALMMWIEKAGLLQQASRQQNNKILGTTNKLQIKNNHWSSIIFNNVVNQFSDDWWKKLYLEFQKLEVENDIHFVLLQMYICFTYNLQLPQCVCSILNKLNNQIAIIVIYILQLNKDKLEKQVLQRLIINKLSILDINPNQLDKIFHELGQSIFNDYEIKQIRKSLATRYGKDQELEKSQKLFGILNNKQYEQAAQYAQQNDLYQEFVDICQQYLIPIFILEEKKEQLKILLIIIQGLDVNKYDKILNNAKYYLKQTELVMELVPQNIFQFRMQQKLERIYLNQ